MNGKSVRPLVRGAAVFAFLVAGLAMVGACGADTTAEKDNGPEKSSSTASTTAAGEGGSRRIPQPVVPGDIPVAPESERVDLSTPTFSDPTNVTNPLFPVSKQGSVLFVGHVDGKPFRTEVTLLPETRIIEWQGQQIETLVSQYVAYLDGRIEEVAYDLYAQADDGSVWYFGEDVADFEDGAIVTKEGTWIVGKDGPAAMIMPADPKVGDVYRTENIPGIAFEEVTVKSVDQALEGPLGPVEGGLVAEELHMDGKTEDKTFAPGYGEFLTAGGGDVEALALAVPTDAVDARDTAQVRQAAIDAAQWSLDLQLQYRPPAEIDLARFDLWAAQLGVDAAAGDAAAVNGDFFTLDYIRDRILTKLDGADVTRINIQLAQLESAVGDEDLTAASDAASALRDTLAAHTR